MGNADRLGVARAHIRGRLCVPPRLQHGAMDNATTQVAAMSSNSNILKIRPILSMPISTNQPLTRA
jgi:hypothetical protein